MKKFLALEIIALTSFMILVSHPFGNNIASAAASLQTYGYYIGPGCGEDVCNFTNYIFYGASGSQADVDRDVNNLYNMGFKIVIWDAYFNYYVRNTPSATLAQCESDWRTYLTSLKTRLGPNSKKIWAYYLFDEPEGFWYSVPYGPEKVDLAVNLTKEILSDINTFIIFHGRGGSIVQNKNLDLIGIDPYFLNSFSASFMTDPYDCEKKEETSKPWMWFDGAVKRLIYWIKSGGQSIEYACPVSGWWPYGCTQAELDQINTILNSDTDKKIVYVGQDFKCTEFPSGDWEYMPSLCQQEWEYNVAKNDPDIVGLIWLLYSTVDGYNAYNAAVSQGQSACLGVGQHLPNILASHKTWGLEFLCNNQENNPFCANNGVSYKNPDQVKCKGKKTTHPGGLGTELCDSACGASQVCHGKLSGDSIPSCTAGKSFILDKCNDTCQSVDRSTQICEADYGCTADRECDGAAPGSGLCNENCKYQTPQCTQDAQCNDNNPCTDDSCVNYHCINQNDDTNACSDSLWCTVSDHCSSGQCIGQQRDCNDNIACTTDSCNENNDMCEHTPVNCQCTQDSQCNDNNPCTDDSCSNYHCVSTNNNANICSDSLWCTVSDHCSSGQCIGQQRDCNDNIACTSDSCNENNDMCEHTPVNCQCTKDSDCNDANPCTDDLCINYKCVNQNDDTNPCIDYLWCTVNDHCSSGQCVGQPVDCNDNIACTVDSCAESNKGCINDPVNCQCFQNSDCDDNNPCTDDYCSNRMCVHQNNNNPCQDGLWCTINDCCSSGQCIGSQRDCNDNIACTTDSCDESNDVCIYAHSNCQCTQDSQCNDNNPCTDDYCSNYQCINQNDDTNICSDNQWCTVNDHCSSGQCIGQANTCNDDVFCTTDSCNENNDVCEHNSRPCRQSCTLTSAYWNTTLAVRGEAVKLIAKGISCENDTADFTIKEDALLANQAVQNPPPQVNFSNDKAEVVWTAEFRDNFTKDPNYYFTVFAYNTSISSKNQTNGTLTVIRSNDLDNDSVTNDKDCNDYNASVGECKGCAICSDAKGISGACILGNCSKVKCAESLCGGGTCKSDELAVYPDIAESTCKIINGTGVCMAGNCTFQCKKYDACLKDSDNDSVTDANDKCSNTTTKSVNIFGCPLPKYEKFRNEITTNFSKVDLLQATNVVIGIPGVGMLEFKSNSMNLVGKNLDDYIDIQQNKISVNTAPLPELNVPAVVTLYNINYKKPIIVLDNVYCDSCKFISYDNGIFKFLAQHFSTYSLADWDSYVGFCGDKFCSSSETCASCYQDCGTCPKPPDIIPEKCTESWSCGEWSGCEEGETAKRACSDLNNCGTTLNKPQETISCTELRLQQLQKYNFMIIMGVIILLFTVSYEISGRLKKRSFREHETPELSFWVEKYLTEGYDKVKIKELLSSKGYSKKEIENAMKKAKKDVLF